MLKIPGWRRPRQHMLGPPQPVSLTNLAISRPVRNVSPEPTWMTPEECQSRLTFGFHIDAHMCAHACAYEYTHI